MSAAPGDWTIPPDLVIGGDGPLWSVTAHIPRALSTVTDTYHVRAITEAGAVALAQEVRIDANFYEVFRVEDKP